MDWNYIKSLLPKDYIEEFEEAFKAVLEDLGLSKLNLEI